MDQRVCLSIVVANAAVLLVGCREPLIDSEQVVANFADAHNIPLPMESPKITRQYGKPHLEYKNQTFTLTSKGLRVESYEWTGPIDSNVIPIDELQANDTRNAPDFLQKNRFPSVIGSIRDHRDTRMVKFRSVSALQCTIKRERENFNFANFGSLCTVTYAADSGQLLSYLEITGKEFEKPILRISREQAIEIAKLALRANGTKIGDMVGEATPAYINHMASSKNSRAMRQRIQFGYSVQFRGRRRVFSVPVNGSTGRTGEVLTFGYG